MPQDRKKNYILPANSLDEAFALLEQEECYYNFASIEIRYGDFVYTVNKQHFDRRLQNNPQATSDRRQGCDRRTISNRRSQARETAEGSDRRRATA